MYAYVLFASPSLRMCVSCDAKMCTSCMRRRFVRCLED